jgi:hypothetical protein
MGRKPPLAAEKGMGRLEETRALPDMTRIIGEAYAAPKETVARALPFSGSPRQ